MIVYIPVLLILILCIIGFYKLTTNVLKMPVFGNDKDLAVINKTIAVLILCALAFGGFLLIIGLMNLAARKEVGVVLTISGTVLFSAALVSMILFSNRWRP